MGEQLKNLKCIKQRIISGFFRTINNEFHGFRLILFINENEVSVFAVSDSYVPLASMQASAGCGRSQREEP